MSGLRVLLVEDSPDDASLLLRALERGGFECTSRRVDTAEDMEAALEQESWDIVFSDWSMPHFSAQDALRVLQGHDLDLPFIIVSGTVGEDVVVASLRAGAHDFFVKDKLVRLIPAVERELREATVRHEGLQMREQLMIAERMASLGLLAAGIAHEVNNPLAAVIGNLDLALRALSDLHKESADEAPLREVIDELRDVQESAERIRRVSSDLKLFARADTEERSAVDVRQVIESSIRMAQTEIRHRSGLLTHFSAVPLVDANESRLGQVILNLIVNAAQSIPEGHADENEISVETRLAADGRVVVEVSDTGSGIAPEAMKRLFTPFFTTKPVGVGTGLGLSICHRIVTALGGTMTVESEIGKGSTFRVHLLPAVKTATAPPCAAPEPRAMARRGAVLIVDDDPVITMLVRRVLAVDHDVTVAQDGRVAFEAVVAGARYDVILCDLMMPHMTGMDLHAELARVAPDQAEAMVFLTGGAFTTRAHQFLEEVPNLRLDKPFDIDSLRAIVNDGVV